MTTLALGVSLAVGCGGQSVRQVSNDGGATEIQGDGDLGAPARDTCAEQCLACFASMINGDCAQNCETVRADAVRADCAVALDALLECRSRGMDCDALGCEAENNGLAVCVIDYCERDPRSALCTTPL
jgi:hypothetical protein